MYKILFFLIIFLTSLFSNEFYLNPYYENKLKTNLKSFNIVKDYVRFLNTLGDLNTSVQIEKVNTYLNRLVSQYDAYNYKNEDYWATPFEFLSHGGGDCEDYVIAKKYTLEKLGISPDDMYLSVVKEKFIGGDHMVLSLQIDKDKDPLILDNLSFRVLSISKRVDLDFIFMFNESGFYKLKDKKRFLKINAIDLPQYKKMQNRNKEELIFSK